MGYTTSALPPDPQEPALSRRDLITLKGVRLQVPARRGGRLSRRVDLRLWLDLGEAAFEDRIERTVDYREVHRCLCSAAARGAADLPGALAGAVLEEFPQVEEVEVVDAEGPRVRRARGEGDGGRG